MYRLSIKYFGALVKHLSKYDAKRVAVVSKKPQFNLLSNVLQKPKISISSENGFEVSEDYQAKLYIEPYGSIKIFDRNEGLCPIDLETKLSPENTLYLLSKQNDSYQATPIALSSYLNYLRIHEEIKLDPRTCLQLENKVIFQGCVFDAMKGFSLENRSGLIFMTPPTNPAII